MSKPKRTYRIGEVAEIMGLSSETIRYYERKGIIDPLKDRSSGYRSFSSDETFLLSRLRMYMLSGFSVDETIPMLQDATPYGVLQHIANKTIELDQQMTELQHKKAALVRWLSQINDGITQLGQFIMGYRPAIYVAHTFDDGKAIKEMAESGMIRDWINMAPLSMNGSIIRLDEDYKVVFYHEAMCLLQSDAHLFHIVESKYVELLPACPCLHYATVLTDRDSITRTLQTLTDYIDAHAFVLKGDIMSICSIITNVNRVNHYYTEYYIPI